MLSNQVAVGGKSPHLIRPPHEVAGVDLHELVRHVLPFRLGREDCFLGHPPAPAERSDMQEITAFMLFADPDSGTCYLQSAETLNSADEIKSPVLLHF